MPILILIVKINAQAPKFYYSRWGRGATTEGLFACKVKMICNRKVR